MYYYNTTIQLIMHHFTNYELLLANIPDAIDFHSLLQSHAFVRYKLHTFVSLGEEGALFGLRIFEITQELTFA